ncbi:MAG: EF-P lysine aminoacylase EpmA [Thalassobaculales bacterium]
MESSESWWRPESHAARRPRLLQRQAVLAAIRRFFAERGFVEAETPCLQFSPGLEPHLMAFSTVLVQPQGSRSRLYLHTSPEFTLKKLLVAGEPRLFHLARVFRNGERSATHHPEFTMLEWYRAGAAYTDIMEDCEALFRAAAEAAGVRSLSFGGRSADPFAPWQRISVAEAFARFAGIELAGLLGPEPAPLAAAARAAGIRVAADDRWSDIFTRVMLEKVEPRIGLGAPTILYDYPASEAALSRPKPEDPRFAERFEIYACGVELANAFGELTDPVEQRRRFEADMALKERLYGVRYPIDEDFLAALAHGMPQAAGIALGVDRLVMLLTGAARIEEVLWAPVALQGS